MMNKKLITLAVAAAMAAPAAALAEATLYGRAHVSLDYVDVDEFSLWGAVPSSNAGLANLAAGVQAYGFGVIPGLDNGIPSPLGGAATPGTIVPVGTANTAVGVIPFSNANTFAANLPAGTVVNPAVTPTGTPTYTVPLPAGGTTTITQATAITTFGGANRAGADAFNTTLAATGDERVARVAQLQAQYAFATLNTTDVQRLNAENWAAVRARGASFKGWGMNQNDRASRIGVKGSEDLGGGLKAIYQIEMNIDLANENRDTNIANGNRANGFSLRNSFVGLAGNFGTVLMGRHDTPYKISTGKLDLFSDTLADYNFTIGFNDVRADSTVAYISPSFAGFQFAGAVIPSGGATPGTGYNPNADGIADAWSTAIIYKNGPFYGSAAYEVLGDEHWEGGALINGFTQEEWYRGLYGKNADDDKKWRIGLGLLDWNGFSLTGVYENRSNVLGAPRTADVKLWQVQAGYAFGNNMIKGMYGQADVEGCADPFNRGFRFTCARGLGLAEQKDKSSWAVGFDHNFSKRTKAYVLYTNVEDDNTGSSDWSGFSLGMLHKF